MEIRKLSQSDLVKGNLGDSAQISRWLKGEISNPSTRTINRLVDFFKCDKDWLAHGIGVPFPTADDDGRQSSLIRINSGMNPSPPDEIKPDTSGDESWKMSDMIYKTTKILESKTVYRSALASNVRAFYEAVQKEEEMQSVNEKLDTMQQENRALAERMVRMEAMLTSLGATLPEEIKRDKIAK